MFLCAALIMLCAFEMSISSETSNDDVEQGKINDYCDGEFKFCNPPLLCIKNKCRFQKKAVGEPCTKSYQCPIPLDCVDGVCGRPIVIGKKCRAESDCPGRLICRNHRCGRFCQSSEKMLVNLVVLVTLTLLGLPRVSSKERWIQVKVGKKCDNTHYICKFPLKCVLSECVHPDSLIRVAGHTCQNTYQCLAPFECVDGICATSIYSGRRCETTQTCPRGLNCVRNICRMPD